MDTSYKASLFGYILLHCYNERNLLSKIGNIQPLNIGKLPGYQLPRQKAQNKSTIEKQNNARLQSAKYYELQSYIRNKYF